MKTDPNKTQNPSAVKRPALIERLMAFENQFANEESDLLWEAIDAISGMGGRIVMLERDSAEGRAFEKETVCEMASLDLLRDAAALEREECAKIADARNDAIKAREDYGVVCTQSRAAECRLVAKAIRARSALKGSE